MPVRTQTKIAQLVWLHPGSGKEGTSLVRVLYMQEAAKNLAELAAMKPAAMEWGWLFA